MKNLTEQITAVEREIAMRKRVYPRWIESERMTQSKADHEIECMEAVLRTLQVVKSILPVVGQHLCFTQYRALMKACGQQQEEMF